MQVFPTPRLRLGLPLTDWKGGSHSSPSLALLWHGSAALPVQAALQGRQDVLDCLLSLSGPAGWQTGQPS